MKKCLLVMLQIAAFAALAGQSAEAQSDNVFSPVSLAASGCVQSSTTLCLSGGRFGVTASWRNLDGSSGEGTAVSLTGDTGYFWFFDSANVEVITKTLNACVNPFNAYWVFASGLTNLQVTLTYTDTYTGLVHTYQNPQGTAFVPIQDTTAFLTCSATPPGANVTGTWNATISGRGYQLPATVTLVQTGTTVTGTAAITNFGSGSLTGTVSGQILTFSIDEINPCLGSFGGSLTIGGGNTSATGNFTGNDCGGYWNASVSGRKAYDAGPPPSNTANVTGTWHASLVVSSTPVHAVLTFVQNGNSVTGTAAVASIAGLQSSNSGGFVHGTISGQHLAFTIDEVSPCTGSFSGAATISGDASATGSGSGSDCTGYYTASISGSKQ